MSIKVLIVDDSATIRKQVEFCLKRLGIQVEMATTGAEGIEVYWKHQDIDLLISDIFMPIIDGLEMIKRIKRLGFEGPCVIISQSGRQDLIDEAKGIGVVGWIIKPFTEELLRTSVEKVLKVELYDD